MKYYAYAELSRLLNEPVRFDKLDDYIHGSTDPVLVEFLEYLKRPNAELFIGWMEQWKELREIVLKGETSGSFSDYLRVQGHTLYASFQQFVTPFLFPQLMRTAESGMLSPTLEYVTVLEPDARAIIENVIYEQISSLFTAVHQLQAQKKVTEEQLVPVIHEVVNDQITAVLNAFSKRSYVHVISYVEHCFSVLESKGCTVRLANWIVKQLQQLKLNPDHLRQLSDFQQKLRSGEVRVENKGTRMSGSLLKPVLTVGTLVVFAGLITWIIVFKPWSEHPAPQELAGGSSFTEFTVEERKHIDSLLKIIQPEPLFQYSEEQDFYIEGRELMVDARKEFSNTKVDNFYKAWEEYLLKDSMQTPQKCKELAKQITKDVLPEGFTKLSEKKNGKSTFVRNESDFAVQVLVFNDQPGAKAYYCELKKDEQVEFNMNPGEFIAVVAGKHAIPYQAATESIVFCEIDNATISSLLTSYVLKASNEYSFKFLISGTNISDFQLIDMYGVLELNR